MPAHLVPSSLLWIATLASQGTDPATTIDTDQTALGCAHCAAMKAALIGDGPFDLMRGVDRAADSDTDVLHYDLTLSILPTTQSLSGTNIITVRSLVPALTDFDVSIANVFTVSVTINGNPTTFVRLSPQIIRIALDHPYGVNDEFDVAVTYSGVATVGGGFGSLTWSTSGGLPYVYTLSEPYYGYTWWPTKDVNTDKATADLRYTVPGTVKVAANGLLVSNTLNPDTTRTFHYHTDYQTSPYLFCFGVGNYNFFSDVYTHALGTTPLDFALLAGSDTPANRTAWLKIKNMLPVYEPMFGLYPFYEEKAGIYQFGFGGGMEHQTMTGQGTTNESVCAHELGHQWWGDMITCATWNDIWLNEGFATYTEALWEERKSGVPNALALKSAMAARKPSSFGNSVYVPVTTSVDRIFDSNSTYNKGGWVLHMLRHKIGDTAFFNTLTTYRAAHEYGNATTSDFQAAAELVSGADLDQFFTQWVYWTGAPTLRYALRAHVIDGQNYAEIYLRQSQSGSPYTLDVDMRISTAGGGIDRVLPISTVFRHYLFPLSNAPTSLQTDPNGWLLFTNASTITFAEGPPRIVSTVPAPGSVLAAGALTNIVATFHKAVNVNASDVFLTGANVGPVPISISYNAPSKKLTVTPLAAPFHDTYTLTIADTVTDTAGSPVIALDGEMVGGSFPSGDGLAGGSAQFTFVVSPPACPGDITGDGTTNVSDFNVLASHFGATVPAGTLGDLTGNGLVDVNDFNILAGNFGCGVP